MTTHRIWPFPPTPVRTDEYGAIISQAEKQERAVAFEKFMSRLIAPGNRIFTILKKDQNESLIEPDT